MYIIIDKSYLSYYSMFSVWGYIKEEHYLEDNSEFDPCTVSDFRIALSKKIEGTIQYALSKLYFKIRPILNNVIFAEDCPKSQIWRNNLYKEYKLTRKLKSKADYPFNINSVFNYINTVIIPEFLEKYKGSKIISVNGAEGDDIIASLCKYFKNQKKIIIANDRDYLQLLNDDNTVIINCLGKVFNKELQESGLSATDMLLKKILMGDKADNIKPVIKRCGDKTAINFIKNKDSLKSLLKEESVLNTFKLNQKLIDFDYIPEYIYKETVKQFNK